MMKKIIDRNIPQQLFQALFGTVAFKISLNKAGTFAAPIRATAKVMENLLKFANKRSFNLFVFASAVSLNTLAISDALAKTGCFVESDNYVYCYNSSGVKQKLPSWSEGYRDYKVASYTTDGDKLIVTRKDGHVVEFTYDTSANTVTNNYVGGSSKGTTNTYTFDNNGNKIAYVSHQSSGNYDLTETYDPTTGNKTSEARINSNGSGYAYAYDPTTGRQTSDTIINSNGSGRTYTYDPTTGKRTSEGWCDLYNSDATCKNYHYIKFDTYDENGNWLSKKEYRCDTGALCEFSDGKFITSGCMSGYLTRSGSCIWAGGGCGSGYVRKDNECLYAESGCGAGWRAVNGTCFRVGYTPSEAAEITTDADNTLLLRYK